MGKHYRIIIVGGGSAGISTAARLLNGMKSLAGDIAIIDPADHHYYQPLWTLVGGGAAKKEDTERSMKEVIPEGAVWVQQAVASFDPKKNEVKLENGETLSYDYLVAAAGIEIHWDGVKGLKEALGKGGVCSNYSYDYTDYTWEAIRSFKGGNAVFTHPATPVKCGGAPQKIMYLAEDHFSRTGIRDQTNVIFGSANPAIFDVQKYRDTLEKVVARKKIDARFRQNLIEIRADKKEAVFENLDTKEQSTVKYDMIHVTPPMRAPSFIRNSPLAGENGWVDVHPYTLQHQTYENVFALGDCADLPTSKTGAAIRKQAPVVAENVLALLKEEPMKATYDGYSSCPLVTGYNSLVLAEFKYGKIPSESFPLNQAKERRSMYIMKKDLLPIMYWDGMLKGIM
ncbi:FAD/NAD(P)-binding oxidoreductase [Bacillus badius]|uniref:FAD-dependent pyridine nucleotide-disulfide oxidoreductase n=1 Tax=Bacillus badius TaxID=1455 RepID=A0ABR5AV15_BACBA|nr:FAD/NAD(P)-binding oxidoreductase [Bacillus badius]KIL76448.1 FAD-dependent pyridine nucleotide-disulfide oxidoreductase [Bacillus badius]KIL78565.1 FAD-dependent pyridine nucleotide-disulfide oxidoreductase [Bacillus badius]KZR58675.1 pyridine nucleotide-disulfide oxidoreductase [Bacillus badius]MED4715985.1 FAD/NAD(P)-binding oxidoreductase [Bacillus badius]